MEILDEAECLRLLGAAEVGRLGIAIMNKPDIFPVNFVVDEGTVVFRTAEGTKFAAAVLGEAVAFEVDGYDAQAGEAWSVVVTFDPGAPAPEMEAGVELLFPERAPPGALAPGTWFELYEGRRRVAVGTVLDE
jgi:hypothetical protein